MPRIFCIARSTQFAGWTASYSQGSNGRVTVLGQGGDVYGTGYSDQLTSASVPLPPSGDWVVHIGIYFACSFAGGEPRTDFDTEVAELGWFDPADPPQPCSPVIGLLRTDLASGNVPARFF